MQAPRYDPCREGYLNEWQNRWDTDGEGRVTYPEMTHVDVVHPESFLRAVPHTGHGTVYAYLHRFGLRCDSFCRGDGISVEDHALPI